MQKTLIHLIAAARPNFMKIAPLYHAFKCLDFLEVEIVHTGQHYDYNMSDSFFEDLKLPQPDHNLGVGSGTHAQQTAAVMIAYEALCQQRPPNLVIVVGDVNSTLACSLVAAKMQLPLAHLEAGLRSGDRSMPEEINRIVTDSLCDLLWTPSPDADQHLLSAGISANKIVRVGNIMIDSLEMLREVIENQKITEELELVKNSYALVTLHRPSNVDSKPALTDLCQGLFQIAKRSKLVFPIHPRTKSRLEEFGLLKELEQSNSILLLEPQPYKQFMKLVFDCRLVITDSGGVQEETTYLGIPCITLRANTERPITISQGTNRLSDPARLCADVEQVLSCRLATTIPDLWDGKTAGRVVESTLKFLQIHS